MCSNYVSSRGFQIKAVRHNSVITIRNLNTFDFMSAAEFSLPAKLQTLIDDHKWPLTEDDCRRQNLKPWVSADRVQLFAPDEDRIYFYCPPFPTVAWCVQHGGESAFWNSDDAVPNEIDFERAVPIGDFGVGSDSPRLRRV